MSSKNRTSSKNGPDLLEGRRIGGLLTKLCANSLDNSLERYKTQLYRQSILVADYVQTHGEYPEKPLPIEDYNVKMGQKVAKVATNRARKRGTGATYGTPKMLLASCKWLPDYARSLRAVDEEATKAYADLAMLKKIFVVKAQDTLRLRAFARPPAEDTAVNIKRHVIVDDDAKMVVYGGGNLRKERVIAKGLLVNIERGDDVKSEEVKKECEDSAGIFSVNVLTQKGTESPEELMNNLGLPAMVSVLPLGAPAASEKRSNRYKKWEKYDNPSYFQKYLDVQEETPGILINQGENAIFAHFKKVSLSLQSTTLSKKEMTCSTVIKTNGQMEPGRLVVKPKIDGTQHFLVVQNGYAYFYGRDKTIGDDNSQGTDQYPYYEAKGKTSMPNCEVILEIVKHSGRIMPHIVKIMKYGPFTFRDESVQNCAELERSLEIKVDGIALDFACIVECTCPIDGIIVCRGRGYHYYKEFAEKDVEDVIEERDHQLFTTLTRLGDGTVTARHRKIRKGFKKIFQNEFALTISPKFFVGEWDAYKRVRRRGFAFVLKQEIDIDNSTLADAESGCFFCADQNTDECTHGTFCHKHLCTDCWGIEGISCTREGCTENGGPCEYGPPHCALEEHLCNAVREAWNIKKAKQT